MAATHSLQLVSSSSQSASIADASCPNLKITGSQTWMAWINIGTFASSGRTIMGRSTSTATQILRLEINPTGGVSDSRAQFQITGLTTNTAVTSISNLTAGVWVHVTGVYDSSNSKLLIYINGELENSVTASGTANNPTSKFGVGILGDYTSHNYFDGKIRNARVYASALTQAQIRSEMNVDTPAIATVGDWPLNNAYTDNSGNGYTLTPSGSPTFSTTYPDAIDLVENGTYLSKHKITIDNTKVSGSSDLTDVPVVFTEDNFLADAFSNSLNGGADIRFSTDEDGKIRLAHEIVTWNTGTSVAEVHVKVNTLSYNTDTDIYVHYNNSSAVAIDENGAFGKHQVWGTNWKAVYPLQSLTVDSTRSSFDLTNNNTVGSAATKIGNGADFSASNTNKSLSYAGTMGYTGSSYTVLLWMKMQAEISSGEKYMLQIGDTASDTRIDMGYEYNGGTRRIKGGRTRNGVANDFVYSNQTLGTSNWHHMAVSYNGSTVYLHYNGSNVGNTASSGNGSVNQASGFRIGSSLVPDNYVSAYIDQVMLYSGQLSDDFITTLYNNQNSPSTFATASAVGNTSAFFMFL